MNELIVNLDQTATPSPMRDLRRLCGAALDGAASPAEAARVLREAIATFSQRRDKDGMVLALRVLRKREGLKPAEYRRLVVHTQQIGKARLIERYVGYLRRIESTKQNWAKVAIFFWAAEQWDDLFAWAPLNPQGAAKSSRALLDYASNSLERGELEAAGIILRRIFEIDITEPETLQRVKDLSAALEAARIAAEERQTSDFTRFMELGSTAADQRDWRVAIDAFRKALAAAPTKADAIAALRRLEIPLQIVGERSQAISVLRRVRKLTDLKINENRRLFRNLRAMERDAYLGRYLRVLMGRTPTKENWSKVATALWACDALADLFQWASLHPAGVASSTRVLMTLAENSIEHDEGEVAAPMLRQVEAWAPESVDTCLRLGGSWLKVGRADEALRLGMLARSLDANADVSGLLDDAANAELNRIAQTLDAESGSREADSLARIEAAVGATPLLLRVRDTISHWSEARTVAAPMASVGLSGVTVGDMSPEIQAIRRRRGLQRDAATEIGQTAEAWDPSVETGELPSQDSTTSRRRRAVRIDRAMAYGQGAIGDYNPLSEMAAEAQGTEGSRRRGVRPGRGTAYGHGADGESISLSDVAPETVGTPTRPRRGMRGNAMATHTGNGADEAQSPHTVTEAPIIRRAAALRRDGTAKYEQAGPGTGGQAATDKASSDWKEIAGALDALRRARSPHEKLDGILQLLRYNGDYGVRAQIEAAFADFLSAELHKLPGNAVPEELTSIIQQAPHLAHSLAQHYVSLFRSDLAIDIYWSLASDQLSASHWLEAAKVAQKAGALDAVKEFCISAAQAGGLSAARSASTLLLEHGFEEDALDIWSEVADPRAAQFGTLTTLYALGRVQQLAVTGYETLKAFAPLGALDIDGQHAFIKAARLIVSSQLEAKTYSHFTSEHAIFGAAEPGNALAHWCDAMLLSCAIDDIEAHRRLALAEACPTDLSALQLDLAAERALLHLRFQQFGDARRALGKRTAKDFDAHYGRRMATLERVEAFCEAEHFPECLLDIIVDEATAKPLGYEPEPGHVLTVSSTLAQGGSERQAVNILQAMSEDSRIKKQTMAVRSVTGRNGFFLPDVKALPVELCVYGEAWSERMDIDKALPQLHGRTRLRDAIELLSPSMREELVRVTALLLKYKPAAVQLRQDLFIAGIACLLAGVPRFLLHRGSLARGTWGLNRLQEENANRPMRHTYRRLFAHSNVTMVNNSGAGMESDIEWTQWEDRARFRIVHNAMDFDSLDANIQSDLDLRDNLKIPHDAPVIGGVFRIVGVKRPMLWVEIARLVLEQRPDAHFIMAGDHAEYGARVRQYAETHGFSDRLHMPGAVADVANWYRIMDVLLLTSEREGLPNVLIEAQHFAVPTVSSDVGGARDTMQEGVTSLLVPADAPASVYAEHVLRAVSDKQWRETAVALAPEFVINRFGKKAAVALLLDVHGLA